MRLPSRSTLITSVFIACWAFALAGAYWWYQLRYIRSFSPQAALFTGQDLRLPADLAGPGPIRIVHFWDPACPCNVGNQQHLGELMAHFAPLGVRFYAVQKPASQGQLPASLAALTTLSTLPGSATLPASPAVAIWDQQGQLAYFGPYSEGANCTSSNSFIEPILDALIAGRPVNASNTLAVGCFCDWQQP
jgi:hypothetical protein